MGWFKKLKKKARKAVKKVEKAQNKALKNLHLDSVKSQINVKAWAKNPGNQFQKMKKAYAKDTQFGVSVYKRYVKGEWGSLAKEATGDTGKAFGIKSLQTKQAGAVAQSAGDMYEAYDKGDIEAARKVAEKSEVSWLSDAAKAVKKGTKLYNEGAKAYNSYESGNYAALQKQAGKALQKAAPGKGMKAKPGPATNPARRAANVQISKALTNTIVGNSAFPVARKGFIASLLALFGLG